MWVGMFVVALIIIFETDWTSEPAATESEQRLIPRLRSVSRDPGANILRESLKTIWNFQSYFDFATLFKSFEEQAETRGKTNLIHVSHIGIALADLVNLLSGRVI